MNVSMPICSLRKTSRAFLMEYDEGAKYRENGKSGFHAPNCGLYPNVRAWRPITLRDHDDTAPTIYHIASVDIKHSSN